MAILARDSDEDDEEEGGSVAMVPTQENLSREASNLRCRALVHYEVSRRKERGFSYALTIRENYFHYQCYVWISHSRIPPCTV